MRRLLSTTTLALLFTGFLSPADAQVPDFPPFDVEGTYEVTNLDGSHPYGDQDIVLGVDLKFLYSSMGEQAYSVQGWYRQGDGPKVLLGVPGALLLPPGGPGALLSGESGATGTFTYEGEGAWIASYNGGNTRLWTPQ